MKTFVFSLAMAVFASTAIAASISGNPAAVARAALEERASRGCYLVQALSLSIERHNLTCPEGCEHGGVALEGRRNESSSLKIAFTCHFG
jgi:hypothetical protein